MARYEVVTLWTGLDPEGKPIDEFEADERDDCIVADVEIEVAVEPGQTDSFDQPGYGPSVHVEDMGVLGDRDWPLDIEVYEDHEEYVMDRAIEKAAEPRPPEL